MLNKVILIGRLTRDPELRYTPNSGKAVATFGLAVDRGFNNEVDFINIVVWDKQAETCAQYINKGRMVAVVGRLQVRSYEKDGQKRTISEVVAETVRFLGSANRENSSAPEKTSFDDFPKELNLEDEEIPF